jgi:hypothetical protein
MTGPRWTAELLALRERILAEAGLTPEQYTCPVPATGSPSEITLHGRTGCTDCRLDGRNLDRFDMPAPAFVEVDAGQTRCPRCRSVVQVRVLWDGRCVVANEDGTAHRHAAPAPPSARTPAPEAAPPRPPAWERWRE